MTISTSAIGLQRRLIAAVVLLVAAVTQNVAAQTTFDHGLTFSADAPVRDRPIDAPSMLDPGRLSRGPNYPLEFDSPADLTFYRAGFLQPPPEGNAAPSATAASPSGASSASTSRRTRRRTRVRDASGNKQQTDSFFSRGVAFWNPWVNIEGMVDLPVPGRTKIAQSNAAFPEDRVYMTYKHFHNVLNTTLRDFGGSLTDVRDYSIDRYILGVEKTFCDELWSVELRIPLTTTIDAAFDQGFSSDFGGIGNLAISLKRLLYESESLAVGAGLAVSVPTGEDVRFSLGDEIFTLRNQSPHLLPFVIFTVAPTRCTFYQGYVQLDIPTASNRFDVRDTTVGANVEQLGAVRDKTFLYTGVSAGYWLCHDPGSCGLTGLAAAVDLHYTGALENAGVVAGNTDDTEFIIGDAANELSLLNFNVGLYGHICDCTAVYVGAVFPFDDPPDRLFDAEVQFTVSYGF